MRLEATNIAVATTPSTRLSRDLFKVGFKEFVTLKTRLNGFMSKREGVDGHTTRCRKLNLLAGGRCIHRQSARVHSANRFM